MAAAAAVPLGFLDETSLLGSAARIADRLQAYAEAGVTTLTVSPTGPTLPERQAALRTLVAAAEQARVLDLSGGPATGSGVRPRVALRGVAQPEPVPTLGVEE